jgi:hypothetical protein
VKGTGRQLNAIAVAFLGSLVIPVYFLRLMADGKKLQEGLRARNALEADIRREIADQA